MWVITHTVKIKNCQNLKTVKIKNYTNSSNTTLAKIQMFNKTLWCEAMGKYALLHCKWECKMMQTPIEGNLEFHMDLPIDQGIIPILIYLKTILAKV